MKTIKILSLLIGGMLFSSTMSHAQEQNVNNDSTVNAVKIKTLKERKAKLHKQIEVEDKKRNAKIEGVSIERLERINEKQDSICLQLRSELVDVDLELKELGADKATSTIMQQINRLRKRPQAASTTAVTTPNKPVKPAKPTKK